MSRETTNAVTAMTKNPWLVLAAMTGSLSMVFLDATIVGVALPAIQADLGLGVTGSAWVVNGYLLALASAMALGGRLGDAMGRVRAFQIGVFCFAASSAACAFAPTGTALVAARVAQGLGACLMQPASSAIVAGAFPEGKRGKAMAVYVGLPLLFMMLGPVLGGALTQWFGWRWNFGVNLPIAALTLLIVAVVRPSEPAAPKRPLAWRHALILMAGLPGVVFGLQELARPTAGLAPWIGVAAIVGGITLLAGFARMQLRSPAPLLDLRLFRDRTLLGLVLILGLAQVATIGQSMFGPAFLQGALGYTPMQSGLAGLPMALPALLLVHVAGRAYDRRGPVLPVRLGTVLCAVGFVTMTLGLGLLSYPVLAIGMAFHGAGMAFIMNPIQTDVVSRVPAAQRGESAGLAATARQVGNSLGIAMGVAVLAHAGWVVPDPASGATLDATSTARAFAWMGATQSAIMGVAVVIAWRMLSGGTRRSET